jgi:hypothetical protein
VDSFELSFSACVALEPGGHRRVADGEARDLCRCRKISIEQRRLHRQRVALVLKPCACSSAGSIAFGSISRPSKSRTALPYSVRLSR